MVHPYLRRREGKEKVEYPSKALEAVLWKTLGVPLFQEQAMKVAIVGAGFTAAEADALRRSMATFKFTGGVGAFQSKMVDGMLANGYTRDFATRTFKQIEGFGSYGFPESHAASFAKIAYASSWMKCHHPDVFCAALLNAQPMGFYAPAQIVRDAREHGVEVRPICINASRWDCTLEAETPPRNGEGDHPKGGGGAAQAKPEPYSSLRSAPPPRYARSPSPGNPGEDVLRDGVSPGSTPPQDERLESEPLILRKDRACRGPVSKDILLPLRLGLRMVRGLSNDHAARIVAARAEAPFASVEEVWRRSGVPVAALEKIADADGFRSLGLDRRQALWRVRGLGETPLPLFAAADARGAEPEVALTPMTGGREVVEDYRAVQLSLRAHPLSFLRAELDRRRIVRCADLARIKDGRKVEVAGIILVRQRPGSTNVTFVTIEDETGIANAIIWQRRFEAQRRTIMSSAMVAIKGTVQREGEVIHVIADHLEDYTPLLHSVGEMHFPHRTGPGDGASHGGAPDPRGDWEKRVRDDYHAPFRTRPDADAVIRQKTRDFH
jgi:error-prone DNA polymerase